jgi:hypothetical protein
VRRCSIQWFRDPSQHPRSNHSLRPETPSPGPTCPGRFRPCTSPNPSSRLGVTVKVPRERKLTATAILEEEGDHPSTMDHNNGVQHYSNHHCRNKNCSDAFDSHAEIPEGLGSGSSSSARMTLKIAMLPPMPSPSVRTAASVKPGDRRDVSDCTTDVLRDALSHTDPFNLSHGSDLLRFSALGNSLTPARRNTQTNPLSSCYTMMLASRYMSRQGHRVHAKCRTSQISYRAKRSAQTVRDFAE